METSNLFDFKQLLKLTEDDSIENIQSRFNVLAEKLFWQFNIMKGDYIYDFLEIEFYFYNQHHKDEITYPRLTERGLWYFHPSGVDITFESDKNHFGGILIRSLLKSDKQNNALEIITGPLKCEYELFDKIDISGIDEYNIPRLNVKRIPDVTNPILKRKRKIPKNKQFLHWDEEYCYYIKPQKYFLKR